jgi:hypothetical protein
VEDIIGGTIGDNAAGDSLRLDRKVGRYPNALPPGARF